MIGKLFYLCPSCLTEDSLTDQRDHLRCRKCQESFPFLNNQIFYKNKTYSISSFYQLIRSSISLFNNKSKTPSRISQRARLRQGINDISYFGRNHFHSIIECPVEVDSGTLVIYKNSFTFKGSKQDWLFQKKDVQGYTTNSKYFEFKIKGLPFFQIYFESESPLKYEDLFTDWFRENSGQKILEHQPKIIRENPKQPAMLLKSSAILNWNNRERFSAMELLLHLVIGLPIVIFLKWYAKLTITNAELVPKRGPFILLMNHQSYLDPIIISTVIPRRIGFFTKSTSFADRLLQPIFRAYRSLPNRRYEIDPQIVRHALQVIRQGHCIGIFPEGERTWNGELLPFKYSTIKFLLSVQVPIIIMSIQGAYTVLPRWSHKINPGQIKIDVQRCFSLRPGKWQIEDLKNEVESFFKEI
jgi:1-acyl-sn-glycerol-3-phosphate acyltransferase